MTLEIGDHVWYWYDATNDVEHTSTDPDLPRLEWFPPSQNKTDYLGHGKEIAYYAFYDDCIQVGHPQMLSGPGTFAWLNQTVSPVLGWRATAGRACRVRSRPPSRHSKSISRVRHQDSTSARKVRGALLRTALPVAGLIDQAASRRSEKCSASPLVGSSHFPNGHQLLCSRAQATWRDPWPWHASQPTLISENLVAYRSFTAS